MINGNTFGINFKVTTFGESHGPALGVVIDGCPSELSLDLPEIQKELDRRKPGQSRLVSPRKEPDEFEILSGLFEGKTTGTPLSALFRNSDVKSKDYSNIKDLFRPGHADYTYHKKYQHRDYRVGAGHLHGRQYPGYLRVGWQSRFFLYGVFQYMGV
jgi:chorismate synthase